MTIKTGRLKPNPDPDCGVCGGKGEIHSFDGEMMPCWCRMEGEIKLTFDGLPIIITDEKLVKRGKTPKVSVKQRKSRCSPRIRKEKRK